MGVSLLHSMLVREFALVALLVIVLISFYIRYRAAAHKQYVRTRERRMAIVVRSARRQLVVVAVLLAAVLVYDRVLPHFGIGASAARQATVSKHHAPAKIKVVSSSKKAAHSHKPSSKPTKSRDHAKLASSKQAASARMIAASKSAAASRVASASASASQASQTAASSASAASASAASRATASSKATAAKVTPKQKAVTTMQQYLAQHPGAVAGRVDNVGVIDYATDYNGVPAYQVGLYQTQADGSSVAIHMYFVYAGGNVVKAY